MPPLEIQRNDKSHCIIAFVFPELRLNMRRATGRVPMPTVQNLSFVEPNRLKQTAMGPNKSPR